LLAAGTPHPYLSGMTARLRADRLLVERGLFPSRARAQAAIAAGLVTANAAVVRRASDEIPVDAELRAGVRQGVQARQRGGARRREQRVERLLPGQPAGAACALQLLGGGDRLVSGGHHERRDMPAVHPLGATAVADAKPQREPGRGPELGCHGPDFAGLELAAAVRGRDPVADSAGQ